jgi:hypothetical protein
MIGASRMSKNVTCVPITANVSGKTVKSMAIASVALRFFKRRRVSSSAAVL